MCLSTLLSLPLCTKVHVFKPDMTSHCSSSQRSRDTHLTLSSDVPSHTNILENDTDVSNTALIKQQAYRCPDEKRQVMKREKEYPLESGLAKPSHSPWSSPCLLAPKSDGSPHFRTDYRKVNAVTTPDSFPLPCMEDCIDIIGPAKFITKLDLLKGYWQVPLTPRASDISAFVTPVSSEHEVVRGHMWTQHMASLQVVFQQLVEASLTLNLAKCGGRVWDIVLPCSHF